MSRLSYSAFISKCINSCFSYSALESHYAVTVIFRVLSSVTLRGNGWEGPCASPLRVTDDINQALPEEKTSREEREARKRNIRKPIQRTKAHVFPGGPGSKSKWKRGTRDRKGKNGGFIKVLGGKTWRGEVEPLWRFDWMRKPRHSGQFIWKLFSLYQVVLWIIEIVGRGHCVKGCSRSLALCLTPPRRWFV